MVPYQVHTFYYYETKLWHVESIVHFGFYLQDTTIYKNKCNQSHSSANASPAMSVTDKALRWRDGHNFTAASGASSEVKMSTALDDFNLPRCCWSAGSLASAQSNLQCNPRADCFPSSTICTHHPNRLAAEKSREVVKEARFCHLMPSGTVVLNLFSENGKWLCLA